MKAITEALALFGAAVAAYLVGCILINGFGLVMVMIYCQSNCVASLGG